MAVQIAVKLDDGLAEQVRAAAAEAGTTRSEWVRQALQPTQGDVDLRTAIVSGLIRATGESQGPGPTSHGVDAPAGGRLASRA